MKKKPIFITLGLLAALIMLFIIDPAFSWVVKHGEQEAHYEWRLFNNSFCNLITAGHCFTNGANRTNAEINIYRQLLNNYNGQEDIEKKLLHVVKSTYRFNRIYTELTNSQEVKIDSLLKYKGQIFAPIALK